MSNALLLALVFVLTTGGVGLTWFFQSVGMVTASLWAFYGVACALPLALGITVSVRRTGSIGPALRIIGMTLLVGVVAAVLTNRRDDGDA
jgi:hypothetical protein